MPVGKSASHDVAVIGAGVFGSWIAYCLRKAGASVILLDAYGPAHARASSGGESRIIRMGYGPDEIYTRWSLRALPLWQELFAEAGHPELFQRTGVLWIADESAREPYARDTIATLTHLRVPFEKLSNADLRHRYPQIAIDDTSYGILEPSSGVLMARRAVQCVVDQAQKIGVTYQIAATEPPKPASAALRGKLHELATTTATENISAANFVFACGPWLPKLFPSLLANRIFTSRQEIFFFGSSPRRSTLPAPRPSHLAHPSRRILRHARPRIPRPKSRQRSPWPRRRSRHAIAHRHTRSSRRRARISRPPFPRAQKFAGGRDARLPVRKHLERRFPDRSASRLRKCLAGRRRFRSRFQTRSIDRRIRHNANPASGHTQRHINTASGRTTRAPLLTRHKRIRTAPRSFLSFLLS